MKPKSLSPKLAATKDYGLFELSKFNRDVTKINKLMASMREHGYIPAYPLHVTKNSHGKLEIKAGHHRLTAAKELGIPVFYIICNDNATIHELEGATRPWSTRDYLESYCRLGDKQSAQYQIAADYVTHTGVTISCAVSILTGKSDMSEFKRGDFTVTKMKYAQQIADIIKRCKAAGFDHASNTLFVTAIRMSLLVDEFDINQFFHRFEVNRAMRDLKPNIDGFLNMIESIYKKKSSSRLPLAFMAQECARIAKTSKNPKKPKNDE